MVGYLPHCTFNLNPRAASIDTPLHAYCRARMSTTCTPTRSSPSPPRRTRASSPQKIFGDEIGWLPWQRPGFELGLWLETFCRENPGPRASCSRATASSPGATTPRTATRPRCGDQPGDRLARERDRRQARLRRRAVKPLAAGRAPRIAAAADAGAPRHDRRKEERKVGHFDDQPAVLEFVNSQRPASARRDRHLCPDHFLRTKIARWWSPSIRPTDLDATLAGLTAAVEDYRADYAAYYDRCKHADSPAMRDPNAVVYLVPGVGMITFAKRQGDRADRRRVLRQRHQRHARRRGGLRRIVGLPEQEAFDIEYWLLEEAKLQRMPKPKSLAGRIALVTGGAGGIGAATADRAAAEGACVVLADIDAEGAGRDRGRLRHPLSADVVRTVEMNVTDEDAVAEAYADWRSEFGGLDILVSNAGIASAAPIEETDARALEPQHGDPGHGLFPGGARGVPRDEARRDSAARSSSSPRRTASPPRPTPRPTAPPRPRRSTWPAAWRSKARRTASASTSSTPTRCCAARRSGPATGGSSAPAPTRPTRRAGGDYRQRSLLKRSVLPEDIAEAIYFFASDASAKSTGNIINVDAGNVQAFTR